MPEGKVKMSYTHCISFKV